VKKTYTFEFPGTKEMFLNSLQDYPNNFNEFFYFDNYVIKLSDDEIQFGVARGGHSGGFWFIPEITEANGKTIFYGEIQYLGDNGAGEMSIMDRIKLTLLVMILLPLIVVAVLFGYFRMAAGKLFNRRQWTLISNEDKLLDLMEYHLNCTRR